MVAFGKRVLFVGFGSVAQCTLPILVKHLQVPLDEHHGHGLRGPRGAAQAVDRAGRALRPRRRSRRENLGSVLAKHLSAGDLLIDLAWNIDCCEILQWCHDHGVLYLNTSVEVWDPYDRDAVLSTRRSGRCTGGT